MFAGAVEELEQNANCAPRAKLLDSGSDSELENRKLVEAVNTSKRKVNHKTRRIETRVQRQLVLEGGRVIADSGPQVVTRISEDNKVEECERERAPRGSRSRSPSPSAGPSAAGAARDVPLRLSFLAGDATHIFHTVRGYPAARTALVIDPPRKGCDAPFLRQLVHFRPAAVVYVSCNVHTQARDVGWVLREMEKVEGKRYRVESVRGFDLFPQTAHVESVAVLRLEV